MFSLHLAIKDRGDAVAGESVQGLRGGLLDVREVFLTQLELVVLAEAGEVHLDAGLVILLGRIVRARRQEDLTVLGQGVLEVTDPLEVRCEVVIVVFHFRHLEAAALCLCVLENVLDRLSCDCDSISIYQAQQRCTQGTQ